jgi:ATP-binding cassette subfamily B (MDR/TAP) protein 1
MASKISKEIAAMHRGMGEKIGNITMSVVGFVAGFAFSFYWGWLFTCILLCAFPALMIVGIAMGVSMEEGFVEAMKAYAQSAGYAEQALSAIKVVHTYGQEELEQKNYQAFLDRSKKLGVK